jgi:hypothetical protein
MHDTWHKSVIIRVSHATNKFKVQFKSINSSLSFYSPSCNLFAMPRNPQSLAVTVVPTLQQRLLSAIFTSTNCILSFDPTSRSLVTYYWSVLQMFAAWPTSMFAQARWRERASEAWHAEQLSRNPSVPWTGLLMPAADAVQRRVSLQRSSHLYTGVRTLRWRVCGRVCQESMRLSRLVIILAEDIQK